MAVILKEGSFIGHGKYYEIEPANDRIRNAGWVEWLECHTC